MSQIKALNPANWTNATDSERSTESTRAAHLVSRPHVCFVAMNIYSTLTGSTSVEFVGGAEVQQTVLARALVADGFRVSVLTADHGQPEVVDCDGVRVHRVDKPGTRGIKGLRFIHPHSTDIVRGLRTIDPDIVYFRVAGFQAAAAAWYARRAGKTFVYACANDLELMRPAQEPATRRDAFMFRRALFAADGVLVQNVRQKELLRENFDKDGTVLPNCYAEPGAGTGVAGGHVLWAGTVKSRKSPETFIELARRHPGRAFRMVGGANVQDPDGQAYLQRIKDLAATVPNVEFVGYVPFRDVGLHFDNACALVNTSDAEGFPNTFLQAWIRGVPTISFVRPEVVPGQSGTIACASVDDMATQLSTLLSSEQAWTVASRSCKDHFEQVHGVGAALQSYRNLFVRLISQRVRKRLAGR